MPEVDEPMEMAVIGRRAEARQDDVSPALTPRSVLLEKAETLDREAGRLNDQADYLEAELASARAGSESRRRAAEELRRVAASLD